MEPLFAIREIYRNYLISSNSMRVPEKSDGCKNITCTHENVAYMKISLKKLNIFDKRGVVKFNNDQL